MKRGRPKGTGRWSPDADARVWAAITAIMERDRIRDVKRAAHVLAQQGFHHVRDGKRVWTSSKERPKGLLGLFVASLPDGDKRKEDGAAVFRGRYYAAERRRKTDPEYRDYCDALLAIARSNSGGEKITFTG